jgi:16S rRNA (guanine966-N2)-methyltransferase
MQIISGKFRRRLIKFPKDQLFRPTKAIVRESIFNILGDRVIGASFLDLCSGSGAVAFEAESRGACQIICVDRHVKYIMENKELLNSNANIVCMDVLRYLKSCDQQFDIIYFDPVWADSRLYTDSILCIFDRNLVAHNGCLVVEHSASATLDTLVAPHRQYTYGQSALSVFEKNIACPPI